MQSKNTTQATQQQNQQTPAPFEAFAAAAGVVCERFDQLTLIQPAEALERSDGYKYLLQNRGMSHWAFKTRDSLLGWLNTHGVSLSEPLKEEGVFSIQEINGAYSHAATWDLKALIDVPGAWFLHLNNGSYTAAKHLKNALGEVCVIYCNTNVKYKPVFHYFDAYSLVNAGFYEIPNFSHWIRRTAEHAINGALNSCLYGDAAKEDYFNHYSQSPLIDKEDKPAILAAKYQQQRKQRGDFDLDQLQKTLYGVIDNLSDVFEEYSFYFYGQQDKGKYKKAGHVFINVNTLFTSPHHNLSVKLTEKADKAVKAKCCGAEYTAIKIAHWDNGYSLIYANDKNNIATPWLGFIETEKLITPELTPEIISEVDAGGFPVFPVGAYEPELSKGLFYRYEIKQQD